MNKQIFSGNALLYERYLTPLGSSHGGVIIDKNAGIMQNDGDTALYERILTIFLQNQKSAFREISDAISIGNIHLASRLTHTLKNTSAMIGAKRLAAAAYALEDALSGKTPAPVANHMDLLENEFNAVIEELRPYMKKDEKHESFCNGDISREKTICLMETLGPLLKTGDSRCLELLDEIRMVFWPIVEKYKEFITHMELYDFETAYKTMEKLKVFMEA